MHANQEGSRIKFRLGPRLEIEAAFLALAVVLPKNQDYGKRSTKSYVAFCNFVHGLLDRRVQKGAGLDLF